MTKWTKPNHYTDEWFTAWWFENHPGRVNGGSLTLHTGNRAIFKRFKYWPTVDWRSFTC